MVVAAGALLSQVVSAPCKVLRGSSSRSEVANAVSSSGDCCAVVTSPDFLGPSFEASYFSWASLSALIWAFASSSVVILGPVLTPPLLISCI